MSPVTMLKRIEKALEDDKSHINMLTPNEIQVLQACIIACSIKDQDE